MAYEKRIFKNYYLVAADDENHLSISLKLSTGDYIGRIKEVKEYAIDDSDSLLFAKVSGRKNERNYYVLNIAKDHEYAKIEDIVTGPLDSITFVHKWPADKVDFIPVFD